MGRRVDLQPEGLDRAVVSVAANESALVLAFSVWKVPLIMCCIGVRWCANCVFFCPVRRQSHTFVYFTHIRDCTFAVRVFAPYASVRAKLLLRATLLLGAIALVGYAILIGCHATLLRGHLLNGPNATASLHASIMVGAMSK